MRNVVVYTAPEGRYWLIYIPALTIPAPNGKQGRAIGQALSRADVRAAAKDLAAVWLDVPETTIHIGRIVHRGPLV